MNKVIATNARFELIPEGHVPYYQYKIIDLLPYDPASRNKVTEMVLMAETILGMKHIPEILALHELVSSYPSDIPCYLLSIGASLPGDLWDKYLNPERDKAIRLLLDEILERSRGIGVRGELTRRWLIEWFGYDQDKIYKVYEKGANNHQLVNNFLKNVYPDCPTTASSILNFSAHPVLPFKSARPGKRKELVIKKPYIRDLGEKCRLCCEIATRGTPKKIFMEYDSCFRDYLDMETADAFFLAALPLAMRMGSDIISENPVSEELAHNITEILVPALCLGDSRLYAPRLMARIIQSPLAGPGVALCFSGGVDSFYSLAQYYNSPYKAYDLTHLYIGNYLYSKSTGIIHSRGEKVAAELGLGVIKTDNNLTAEFYELNHVVWHNVKTLSQIMPLRKLIGKVILSNGYDYTEFALHWNGTRTAADYELLLTSSLTTRSQQIIDCGGGVTRLMKIRRIKEFPVAWDNLNVCLYPARPINCGVCDKCVRTLLELDATDGLDLFAKSFDLDLYRQNRKNHLKFVLSHLSDHFYREVCDSFLEKNDPLMLELARGK